MGATAKTKNGSALKIRLLATVLLIIFVGAFILFVAAPGRLYPRELSVRELYQHPSNYVGQKVSAVGYLVKYSAPRFGDDYNLCEGDPRNEYFAVNPCIAVGGSSSAIDRYLALTYNGTKYEVVQSPCSFAAPCRVEVSGVFVDRGPVTDASQYVVEATSMTWHE